MRTGLERKNWRGGLRLFAGIYEIIVFKYNTFTFFYIILYIFCLIFLINYIMKKYILLICSLSQILLSQISQGGTPKYPQNQDLVYLEPSTDLVIDRNFNPMVFQYGNEFLMNLDVLNKSSLMIEDNIHIYTLGIHSHGAYGIGLIFDNFVLSDNSELYFYDRERSMYLGSFNSSNNKSDQVFPVSIIKSDYIIIELSIPAEEVDIVRLHLGSIIHDYTDIMGYNLSESSNREDCNLNVACPEGIPYQDQINGTIRVTMGGGLCSASLINNTLNDRTPYVLFADHCVSGSASDYLFLFNYQSNTCTGTFDSESQSVSSSTLLVNENIDSGPDFALLEISAYIPDSYNPYYVGWSKVNSAPQDVFGVHHPGAGIKKITLDATNVNSNGYYWEFQYNDGRIIPGSSGSPLFDENNRQVGIASYIYTNYCDPSPDCYCSQQYSHGYGRFDSAWDMGLNIYLDPLNSGIDYIDGISISGINISHTPLQDMPFENNEILIHSSVSAYTGTIEAVELYYKIGNEWNVQEMDNVLGNNYESLITNLYNGMLIQYYILAINSEGIIESFPAGVPEQNIMFILGELPSIYFTDFETIENDWIIGDESDNATAGTWERAEPVGTYNDQGYQIQPDNDYSNPGEYCFVTGNGNEEGNGGFDDVDNGKTTLYSPIYDLSSYETVLLSYWYWYTNNIGDNGGNDIWSVSVSNNNGSSWTSIQNTSSSNTEWEKTQILLSDLINLNETIQFKFIAEDIAYNGDNGSGGSLVEAAIDNFNIANISENSGFIGDANNDQQLNVLDVVIIVNMILGFEIQNFATGDLNNDSQINIQDIVILINLILDI